MKINDFFISLFLIVCVCTWTTSRRGWWGRWGQGEGQYRGRCWSRSGRWGQKGQWGRGWSRSEGQCGRVRLGQCGQGHGGLSLHGRLVGATDVSPPSENCGKAGHNGLIASPQFVDHGQQIEDKASRHDHPQAGHGFNRHLKKIKI